MNLGLKFSSNELRCLEIPSKFLVKPLPCISRPCLRRISEVGGSNTLLLKVKAVFIFEDLFVGLMCLEAIQVVVYLV